MEDARCRRHRLDASAVRREEGERTVRVALDPETLLVNERVVMMAEQAEVVEGGRAAQRPVLDVVCIAMNARATAGEAAAAIADPQRALDRRRNGAPPPPHVEHVAARVDLGHDDTGIARQTQ